ncbi:MAG: ABC transporter permease subunit, partial [Rhodobacterales bacterium]
MIDNLQILFVWAPIINIQIILEGIFVGAVFALSAYGLALVWGVMNIKNLAQGDFVIMGGYLALALNYANVPLLLIMLIVIPVMFVYGWLIYVIMIRRIIDQDMFVSLLATFGLSLLMQQVLNLVFGPEVQTINTGLPVFDAFDNMVTIPSSKILSLILAGA